MRAITTESRLLTRGPGTRAGKLGRNTPGSKSGLQREVRRVRFQKLRRHDVREPEFHRTPQRVRSVRIFTGNPPVGRKYSA
jgi:hypothetical protein